MARSPRNSQRERPPKPGAKPVLLSGDNPQIAMAYGDAPVHAYIAAMPGWKVDVGRRLDTLITRAVPGVSKAVKWNSPLDGVEDHVWFLGLHCFTKYVKVALFRGASLHPVPPARQSRRTCATSTSVRTITSMNVSSSLGRRKRGSQGGHEGAHPPA